MLRIRAAFAEHGYDAMTMIELAKACQFTRRALYHYFSNKEEAFRESIRYFNERAVIDGLEAGERVRNGGGSALDILAEILDVRYGDTRRIVNRSPHTIELSGEAFRRGTDIMIASAITFHGQLERLIRELCDAGLLKLRPGLAPEALAQLLTDGARGVNQSLPPIRPEHFSARYRGMVEAILFGAAWGHAAPGATRTESRGRPVRGTENPP